MLLCLRLFRCLTISIYREIKNMSPRKDVKTKVICEIGSKENIFVAQDDVSNK